MTPEATDRADDPEQLQRRFEEFRNVRTLRGYCRLRCGRKQRKLPGDTRESDRSSFAAGR